MQTQQLALVATRDLQQLVADAVTEALAARDAAEDRPLSANDVRRRARRRADTVLAALESGALPARREGRRWRVAPADCASWIERGCPHA